MYYTYRDDPRKRLPQLVLVVEGLDLALAAKLCPRLTAGLPWELLLLSPLSSLGF